jgi:hypothetical protein
VRPDDPALLGEVFGRFSIDIHPEGQAPTTAIAANDERIERSVAGGVEMLVSAG